MGGHTDVKCGTGLDVMPGDTMPHPECGGSVDDTSILGQFGGMDWEGASGLWDREPIYPGFKIKTGG